MRIAIGSDHAGHTLRLKIAQHLQSTGHQVVDLGPDDDRSVDYPYYAERVANALHSRDVELGILICGTGIGMSMAANRLGVRAAMCSHELMAKMARAHNDAQALCLGARVVGEDLALAMVSTFLATPFEGGRHAHRVEQLMALTERRH